TGLANAVPRFWQQWPEQLLVYFPMPYRALYEEAASKQSLDKELLLAISRQESAFTPDIRSSANAVGLMQLIRPTAERFAAELGVTLTDVEENLKDPALNIRLGSRFLK